LYIGFQTKLSTTIAMLQLYSTKLHWGIRASLVKTTVFIVVSRWQCCRYI